MDSKVVEPSCDIPLAHRLAAMTESSVHLRMKRVVREELADEGFMVIEEPKFPPSMKMHWSSYRPDLLAYKSDELWEELAVVECETHPNMVRFASKNFASLWFQPYLFRQSRIRWILGIPQGRLSSVDLELRRQWEIWILGIRRPVWKFKSIPETGHSEGETVRAVAEVTPGGERFNPGSTMQTDIRVPGRTQRRI